MTMGSPAVARDRAVMNSVARGVRGAALLPILTALCAGCSLVSHDIVQPNPDYHGGVRVLESSIADGTATYLVQVDAGIFAFDVLPFGQEVARMTVRVKNVGMPSFVGLYLADDREIRLYGTNEPRREGVEMRRDGLDLVMTFTGVPLDLLRQSGRFQVIDVYR